MSLLQDVLRTQTLDSVDRKLGSFADRNQTNERDSDDELVGVVSSPGTPALHSRPSSRPASPGPGAAARQARRPHHVTLAASIPQTPSSDPLRAFQTDVSQRIFSLLSIPDLARCSVVSKKWNKSQTLNYVWFQHYRRENFHDDSLPPGKWTKRESKQNWRTTYLQTMASRQTDELGPIYHSYSGLHTPAGSGTHTPREVREEQWRQETTGEARPSKNEMRAMYKELHGRKPKSKGKAGPPGGAGATRYTGGIGDEDEVVY